MKTELKKLLQLVIEESQNSCHYHNYEFQLILNSGHYYEFIIIDSTIYRADIYIRYNTKLQTITQFTSLNMTHQYCLIEDLQKLFTRAFKRFETENE